MQKEMPVIKDCMTFIPYRVESGDSVVKAKELMRQHHVRHLPVMTDNRVVGVISDRNVKEALMAKNGDKFLVKEIMTPEPYAVTWDTPLDTVLAEMADEKYGCVIVEDKVKRAVGIFTTSDACRAFKELLEVSCGMPTSDEVFVSHGLAGVSIPR